MIELIAKSTSLTKKTSVHDPITAGQINTIKVRFHLEDIWKAVHKTAVFTDGKVSILVLDTEWDGDVCPIPPEVCTTAGRELMVGLIGTNGEAQLIPTIWCSIGTVQKGANPNGDQSTKKTLPIWAQVVAQLDRVSSPLYTSLEKYKEIYEVDGEKRKRTYLRVYFAGLSELDKDVSLQLVIAARRRGNAFKWYTPANFDNEDVNATRVGYGMLAETKQRAEGSDYYYYPRVPGWMPNDGFLQTEFKLTSADRLRGYIDIDVAKWLVPMAKPRYMGGNNFDWNTVRLMGISGNVGAPLFTKILLKRNGVVSGESRNILKLGANAGAEQGNLGRTWVREDDNGDVVLNSAALYVSIG